MRQRRADGNLASFDSCGKAVLCEMANQCSLTPSGRACEDEAIDTQFSSLIAPKMYSAESDERFGANCDVPTTKSPGEVSGCAIGNRHSLSGENLRAGVAPRRQMRRGRYR